MKKLKKFILIILVILTTVSSLYVGIHTIYVQSHKKEATEYLIEKYGFQKHDIVLLDYKPSNFHDDSDMGVPFDWYRNSCNWLIKYRGRYFSVVKDNKTNTMLDNYQFEELFKWGTDYLQKNINLAKTDYRHEVFDLETAKVKSIILCDDFSWVRCAKYIDFNHILIVQASVNSNKHKIYMLDKTTRRSIPIMKKINALLDDPHSISFDTYNNIIISDANLNYVIIYNILDQTHITIGTEYLKNPHFAISYNEKIYICDTDNDRIAIFNNRNELDGHISLNLKNPRSIDINESKFIIADSSNSNIVLYDNQCLYTYSKSLKRPQYVLFNKGKLYVSDFCKNIVIELTKEEMTCEKHNIY